MSYNEYTPKIWDGTDYVTPTPLNHIEQGIADAGAYAREIYKPHELFSITPSVSETYSTLLDKIYEQLDLLPDEVVADGYLLFDGFIYRLSRLASTSYVFTESHTQSSGNLRQTIFTILSSGSKCERYTTATNGTITYADFSSDSISATAYFYGRS